MEYQLFLSNVKERLIEELPADVHVEDYRTTKNNGEVRQGFLFRKCEEGISPIVYMEDYYERYLRKEEKPWISFMVSTLLSKRMALLQEAYKTEPLKAHGKRMEKTGQ